MPETNNYKLPRSVVPVNYHLTLTPDLDSWTFAGSETITIDVFSTSTEIMLNAAELDISLARYNNETGSIRYDTEFERAIFTFAEPILPGQGSLYLEFTGSLNDEMKGFYRSTYTDDNNELVKMAVTQFEASDARRAFPCWDEPNMKATFDVTLIVPKSKVALSNMPETKRIDLADALVSVDYERTPIMSTYLLAFVIGDLDYVESHDSNGVKIRVYTAKNKSNRGKFALDVCCKTLPFYATYFGIAYPLPKMDLVAIPDFAAGAMENWGLVTYRETALLVDEKESSAASKQYVALVVGHESAHMWFGNLVTMDWWTDLWLNEGFATWVEYLCVEHCYPEFDVWTDFASSEYATALGLDSLKSSHPIQVTVEKPSEVSEIFDDISYAKGACLIHMLNDYLTNEKFKVGLNVYLHRHKYKNAITDDLWQALSEASGEPVAEMMDTWTKQTGFPVVSVECEQDDEGNTVTVTLKQRRFLAHGTSDSDQFWIVPVTICSLEEPQNALMKVTMKQNGEPQTFKLPRPVRGFVRINPGSIGFYHVQYQDTMLPSLTSALSAGRFEARDRLGLVLDSFALARSGACSTINALNIAQAYTNEDNITVWSTLLSDLGTISSMMNEMDCSLTPNVDRYLLQLVELAFKNLGWNACTNESHSDRMLRPLILRIVSKAGHEDVIAESIKRFDMHYQAVENCNSEGMLPADIRLCVYSNVLKYGKTDYLNKIMKLLRMTDLHEERMRLMGSLGSVPFNLLSTIHEFAFSDEVRKQDKFQVLLSTVGSAEKRLHFWKFMTTNWGEFRRQISNNHMLGCIIKVAFENFITQERYNELEQFFNDHAIDVKRPVEQTLENIKINIAHIERDGERLREFFSNH